MIVVSIAASSLHRLRYMKKLCFCLRRQRRQLAARARVFMSPISLSTQMEGEEERLVKLFMLTRSPTQLEPGTEVKVIVIHT